MTVEIVTNPIMSVIHILAFGIGLTSIAYIAMVLWLNLQPKEEPVELPDGKEE